jgi:hypothetical protein
MRKVVGEEDRLYKRRVCMLIFKRSKTCLFIIKVNV